MILAGIDAGGTATKCIILDQTGQVLAQSQTGPANYQVVGLDQAVVEIKTALHKACIEAGIEQVDLLGIGMAGAGSEADREKIRGSLLPVEQAQRCYLTDDAEIAVWGAHGGKPGLVTIAGTGSIVYGVQADGTKVRGGGWGPILGDEGSGYWVGLMALQAIIKAQEQRGPKTRLTQMIMEHLQLANLRQLVPLVYQERLPRKELAGLAPLVVEAMEAGDLVAKGIIEHGLDELVLTVQAVYRMIEEVTGEAKMMATAVIGGLFNNPAIYHLFAEKLAQAGQYQTIRPQYPPVYGAVFYGAREAGVKLALGEMPS